MRVVTAALAYMVLFAAVAPAGAGTDQGTEPDQESVPYAARNRVPVEEGRPDEVAADIPPILPGDRQLSGAHDYLSRNVEELARRFDAFFGTERAFEESSGTYAQARNSIIYQKYGEVDFDAQVKAKLDLPNLKQKLSLVIESDDVEDLAQGGRITTGNRTLTETVDSKDVSTSVQVVLREQPTWDLRLQPGIRVHWTPQTFVRLRGRHIQPLSETWLSRLTLTPGWYDPRGWEVRLRHEFDRNAGRGALFRAASEGVWLLKETPNVDLVQSFGYAHPWGSRVWMGYETGVSFETHPTFRDTSYFSSIRYRRNIHRGWVFLELKPQILFERVNDFSPDPSLAVTLEVVFGARYLSGKQE